MISCPPPLRMAAMAAMAATLCMPHSALAQAVYGPNAIMRTKSTVRQLFRSCCCHSYESKGGRPPGA